MDTTLSIKRRDGSRDKTYACISSAGGVVGLPTNSASHIGALLSHERRTASTSTKKLPIFHDGCERGRRRPSTLSNGTRLPKRRQP